MRVLPLLAALLVAGCTTPSAPFPDEPPPGGPAPGLWRPALSAHAATMGVSGTAITLEGDLAPIQTTTLAIPATHGLAVEGVAWQDQRGRLLLDELALGDVTLRAVEDAFVLTRFAVRADERGMHAVVAGSPTFLPNASSTSTAYEGIALPPALALATDATLVTQEGQELVVPAGEPVIATGARLVRPMAADAIAVRLATQAFVWNGTVALEVADPRGTLAFTDEPRALEGHRVATLALRGSGTATLTRGATGWALEPLRADVIDVVTDGAPRIEAALRLVPDTIVVNGTANTTARVQLLAVETSRGAVAHLAGYDAIGDAAVRFRGHEPFEVTHAMLDAIEDAEGPVTPFVALGLGIAVPFVALAEGLVEAVLSLFPPSLAGTTVEPGGGRLLTFDVTIPETEREVEIVLQAANAEPARAVLRIVPDGRPS